MSLHIRIQKERVMGELERLATFSEAPAPAVTRILYTPTDMAARAFIRQLARETEFELREDGLGNIFIRWAGENPEKPAVATGSHIDAIPFAGKYDGTVGVLGGLEAMRALHESGYKPPRPIELIMFTSEEPTRFGLGCLGSRAMAGTLTAKELGDLKDDKDVDLDRVRREAGYIEPLSEVQLQPGHYHSFVELHIEQGPRLEDAGLTIGVVTAIAAPATLRVEVRGDGGHAGAVLMPRRRDALTAASEMVLAIENIAKTTGREDSVATVGLLQVYPGAVNSIASQVRFEVDIRDTDLVTRDKMVADIQEKIQEIATNRRVTKQVEILNADAPCTAGENIVGAAVSSSHKLAYGFKKLVSRAYHDALFMSHICPSGMIFIPSQNGYSHRPEEYSSPEDIVKGINVLAHTMMNLAESD